MASQNIDIRYGTLNQVARDQYIIHNSGMASVCPIFIRLVIEELSIAYRKRNYFRHPEAVNHGCFYPIGMLGGHPT